MNTTIETLLNHRSIRSFKDQPLKDEQIKELIESAQAASTSSFIQAYTIIGVTDREKKAKLAELAGNQPYVEANGHFFVFCADLHRHKKAAELEGAEIDSSIASTEKFMVSVIDASLAAQNAAVAAESMDLGICYIGGIRTNLEEVSDLLECPEYVLPLFGLAVGIPSSSTDQKPRLPLENIYHINRYHREDNFWADSFETYNSTISAYYAERTGGERRDRWTEQISRMLSKPTRMHMKDTVNGKGFMKQ